MMRVVLITGGNLGDVAANIVRARERIDREIGRVVAESSVRVSEPWGFCAPEPFLNQALVVETELPPEAVLARMQAIEAALGRERPQRRRDMQRIPPNGDDMETLPPEGNNTATMPPDRDEMTTIRPEGSVRTNGGSIYASRTMDIDMLFYGDRMIDTELLTVPHPLIAQRAFVLEPLCEVIPGFRHPALGKTIRELRDALAGDNNGLKNEP